MTDIATIAIKRRWQINRAEHERDPYGKTIPKWAHGLAICGYREQGWTAVAQPGGNTVATGDWGDELWLLDDGRFACPQYPDGYSVEAAVERGRRMMENTDDQS